MAKEQVRQNIDFLHKPGKAEQLWPVVSRAAGALDVRQERCLCTARKVSPPRGGTCPESPPSAGTELGSALVTLF